VQHGVSGCIDLHYPVFVNNRVEALENVGDIVAEEVSYRSLPTPGAAIISRSKPL